MKLLGELFNAKSTLINYKSTLLFKFDLTASISALDPQCIVGWLNIFLCQRSLGAGFFLSFDFVAEKFPRIEFLRAW